MNHLEQRHIYLKTQDIVEKLDKLGCTLLGNKDDTWIMELLFKPGPHRYNLIEEILSKFGYYVKSQDSTESKKKSLLSTLLAWGIYHENSNDIFEGTAAVKEQLPFWSSLVDIIWLKHKLNAAATMTDSNDTVFSTPMTDSNDAVFSTPEKFMGTPISDEFDKVCSSIDKLCESDKLQHIFKHDLPLLAPDVQREIENVSPLNLDMLENPDEQKLNKRTKEDNAQNVQLEEIYKNIRRISVYENEDDASSEAELNELEEKLHQVSTEFQNIVQGAFKDAHNDLKPFILNAKAVDFVDVGPAFQKAESLLEDFLQLNTSFPKLESTNCILSKVNSELEDLSNQDIFDDVKYINICKLLKEKN